MQRLLIVSLLSLLIGVSSGTWNAYSSGIMSAITYILDYEIDINTKLNYGTKYKSG